MYKEIKYISISFMYRHVISLIVREKTNLVEGLNLTVISKVKIICPNETM